MIPFGPLAPDRGQISTSGMVLQANNVLPRAEGYGPMQGLTAPPTATALAVAPRGLVSVVKIDRSWQVYVGALADWYVMSATYTWSALGGAFALPTGDDWSFEQFGNFLLGTNVFNGLQAYNVEAPAGFTAITEAGKPRFIFECNDVLVALDCLDDAGNRNTRLIRTSKPNDHTKWVGVGTDYQPLEAGGGLLWGADLEQNAAVICQERALMLMTFGAAPGAAKFGLQVISDKIGGAGGKSMVSFDGAVYWLASDGRFRCFSMGSGLQEIGDAAIDSWFQKRASLGDMAQVQGSFDLQNKIVWWRYKRLTGTSDEVYDDMIGYAVNRKQWITATVQTGYLAQIATPGYNADDLDSFGPADSIDILMDSPFWQGGYPVFGVIDADRKFATFTGENLEATIETASSANNVSGLISWATSLDDCETSTLSLGVRQRMDDAIDWKDPAGKAGSGRTALRGRGSYTAFKWVAPAASVWAESKGIDAVKGATGGPK